MCLEIVENSTALLAAAGSSSCNWDSGRKITFLIRRKYIHLHVPRRIRRLPPLLHSPCSQLSRPSRRYGAPSSPSPSSSHPVLRAGGSPDMIIKESPQRVRSGIRAWKTLGDIQRTTCEKLRKPTLLLPCPLGIATVRTAVLPYLVPSTYVSCVRG